MGRVTSYNKMKLKLLLFILAIFILSFILILYSSATEIRNQKNDATEINQYLNASRSQASKVIQSFEEGGITEKELYKELITSSVKENYLNAYLKASEYNMDIALLVGTKRKVYIESDFLFLIPIYEKNSYVGYLSYLDFFTIKELSKIYKLTNTIDHHYTIKGSILKDGYFSLAYFDVFKISQRIIKNDKGESIVEEYKDILLSFTFEETSASEIILDIIETPLKKLVLKEKKSHHKVAKALKEEYMLWKSFPYEMSIKEEKDNTNSILEWNYILYESTKTFEGFSGFGKNSYPFVEALQHTWTLLFIIGLLLPVVVWILLRLILKLEQTVKTEEEKRRTLSTAVAHELKTPLGILKVYNEALSEAKEEKKKEYQEIIDAEIEHMNSLILDLLQISKLESSAFELNLEEVDLLELANNTANKYEPLMKEKNIEFNVYGGSSILKADLKLMILVYSNILSNAIHSVEEGGKIQICIQENHLYYTVDFFNNGPKLKADELSTIWTFFYSAQLNRQHDIHHTGLGLAVVRAILEAHHASYGCKNTENGVCFWFKIKKKGMK
ncbi:MAG: HAMP domain-containing histidine kinase [Anaeroplasmataceae bacterium]|nr:HAMP domain-containing histidine kinase [Anaeroplasmataceae bacterium]